MEKDPGHEKELEALSPLLASATKAMPFHVPQDYFEGLPQKTAQALPLVNIDNTETSAPDVRSELIDMAPILTTAPRSDPYELPADFEFRPWQPTSGKNPEMGMVRSMVFKKRIKWAAAAVVMAFISLATYIWTEQRTVQDDPLAAKANGSVPSEYNISRDAIDVYLKETGGHDVENTLNGQNAEKDIAILDWTENNLTESMSALPISVLEEFISQHPGSMAITSDQ